jgi:hypothetical protein
MQSAVAFRSFSFRPQRNAHKLANAEKLKLAKYVHHAQ